MGWGFEDPAGWWIVFGRCLGGDVVGRHDEKWECNDCERSDSEVSDGALATFMDRINASLY